MEPGIWVAGKALEQFAGPTVSPGGSRLQHMKDSLCLMQRLELSTVLKAPDPAMLRDPHIREPLDRWLRVAHLDCLDTEILHELKMPRPSARIDIAVVNGELCGFEIKSDVDSLVRLPRQARAFGAVFDRVSVVTTERHLVCARTIVPNWWGVVVVSPCMDSLSFTYDREAAPNPSPSAEALLHMLSKREMLLLLESRQIATGLRSKRRSRLVQAALEHIPEAQIASDVRRLFKIRAASRRPHSL
jgi:hypothetical protein